jgi:hypothetical protein
VDLLAFGGYVEPFGLLGVGVWVVRWGEVMKVGGNGTEEGRGKSEEWGGFEGGRKGE